MCAGPLTASCGAGATLVNLPLVARAPPLAIWQRWTIYHTFSPITSPVELRAIIGQLAVPAKNRLANCPSFRRITHALWPVLFLVCRKAKMWAETQYQRLRFCNKGYNLVMGDLIPINGNKGLTIDEFRCWFEVKSQAFPSWGSTVDRSTAANVNMRVTISQRMIRAKWFSMDLQVLDALSNLPIPFHCDSA